MDTMNYLTYLAHLKKRQPKLTKHTHLKSLYFVATMPHTLHIKSILQGMVSRRDVVTIGIARNADKHAPGKNTGALCPVCGNWHLNTQSILLPSLVGEGR